MALILGVDPGSRVTGYGLLETQVRPFRVRYVGSGCIRLQAKALTERLAEIFSGLVEVVQAHKPNQMAVEDVFVSRNARSALKLGQARGAAIVAGTANSVPVFEYSARQVKLAVVGHGAAEKQQVQQMVCGLLCLDFLPGFDEADGLAIAWCHAHCQRYMAV